MEDHTIEEQALQLLVLTTAEFESPNSDKREIIDEHIKESKR